MENKENYEDAMNSMEPSIMDVPTPNKKIRQKEIEETYTPQPNYPAPQYAPQQEYSENYAPQQNYPQETYESYAPSYDSDVMIEIAEQVFLEKIKKIQKSVDEVSEFKTLAQVKIDDISERLRRIEAIIDKLQISILEKVGSYGKDLETTKKEMSMMQDSFRKVINPKEKNLKR